MSKFNHLVNNFKTGEFSRKMSARTDVEEYKTSCEKILNVFPMKQGGGVKRSGSRLTKTVAVPAVNSGNGIVRTIPFIFSKTEAYVVTINPSILVPAPASVLNLQDLDYDGSDASLLYDINASDFITIVGNNGGTAAVLGNLGRTYTDYNNAPVNDGFYLPFYKSQFNIIGADSRGFHYAQSGDVLIITHNSGTIPPLVITRTDNFTFEVEWYHRFDLRTSFGFQATEDYYFNVLRTPFRAPNTRDVVIGGGYLETHRLFTSILIGGGGPAFERTNGQLNLYDVYELYSRTPFFTDDKLGSTIRIEALIGSDIKSLDFVIVDVNHTGTVSGVEAPADSPYRCLAITPRLVTEGNTWDDLVYNPSSGAASFGFTDNWAEASWSDEYGFPKSVCFFEQRLVFGGSLRDVDTVWASRTGNINVFLSRKYAQDFGGTDETGLNNFIPSNIPEKDKVVDIFGNVNLETDPIDFRPSSQEINAIQWLSSGQALMVGTLGAEYIVSGGQKALSATSITYRRQTSRGGSPIMPVRIDDEVIYVLRDGRACYNFRFNESNGSYLSNEVSLHADHIVDYGQGETVSQFSMLEFCTPRNIMLAINTDNKLVGFTYSPENEVLAWHRFDFGESKVHSVCSIPSIDGDVDEIWLFLEREYNGVKFYSHEKVGIDFRGEILNDPNNVSNFLDGSNVYTNVPSGGSTMFLPHLIGAEVDIYVDGQLYQENVEVTGAGLAIPECTTAVAGLKFDAYIDTNDMNVGGEFGTSLGLTQRIDRIHALLYKSHAVGGGHSAGKIDPIKRLDPVLSTGNYPLDFAFGSAENGAKVRIQSLGAFPMTVLGIVARGQTHDR